jgi:hypothetical protein
MAHQIDDEKLTGAAVGTLGTALQKMVDRAKEGAPPPPDSLSGFAQRIRDQRRAASGAA